MIQNIPVKQGHSQIKQIKTWLEHDGRQRETTENKEPEIILTQDRFYTRIENRLQLSCLRKQSTDSTWSLVLLVLSQAHRRIFSRGGLAFPRPGARDLVGQPKIAQST